MSYVVSKFGGFVSPPPSLVQNNIFFCDVTSNIFLSSFRKRTVAWYFKMLLTTSPSYIGVLTGLTCNLPGFSCLRHKASHLQQSHFFTLPVYIDWTLHLMIEVLQEICDFCGDEFDVYCLLGC